VAFLEAKGIGKTYPPVGGRGAGPRSRGEDRVQALTDISFRLEEGTSLGIIGQNGSGKSTLLRVLAGLTEPTAGAVEHEGAISSLLGLTAGMNGELSGARNIRLLGQLMGQSADRIEEQMDEIVAFSGLADVLHRPVRTYSSGMLLRLGFSISIHLMEFDILLVDEVISVGDQIYRTRCLEKLQELRRGGTILVIATHNLGDVGALCDRLMLLEEGRSSFEGTTEEVIRHYWRSCERAKSRIDGFRNPLEAPQQHGADTGEIRIVQVRFLDGEGREASEFQTGAPITMETSFLATEPVRNPLFRVQLHRGDGVMVFGMNTYRAGIELGEVRGRGRVRMDIPALHLLQGDYYVSVGIWPDEYRSMVMDRAFDYHERAYVISVSSRVEQGAGVVFQDVRWDWELEESPE